jgi:hypothetical protein
MVHVSDAIAGRYLVPLEPRALRYALAGAVPSRPATRRLLAWLLRLPVGLGVVREAAPSIGECFQRPGAPSPFAWLHGYLGERALSVAVLGVSHRVDAVTAALHCTDPSTGELASLVKAPLDLAGAARLLQEAAATRLHAPAATRAGARVAQLSLAPADAPLIIQSAVAGTPASALLAATPGLLPSVLNQLYGWLERYGRQTRVLRIFDAELLNRELIAPLERVAPMLPPAYVRRVARLGWRHLGRNMPVTAAHADLTMWNVLLSPSEAPGVIDWETARATALPLGDLLYGAVDAVAAASNYRDRPAAFRDCFVREGAWYPLVGGLSSRLGSALELEPEWQELCFHACWVAHAAAELAQGGAGEFVEIVRWLGGAGERALGWGGTGGEYGW